MENELCEFACNPNLVIKRRGERTESFRRFLTIRVEKVTVIAQFERFRDLFVERTFSPCRATILRGLTSCTLWQAIAFYLHRELLHLACVQ